MLLKLAVASFGCIVKLINPKMTGLPCSQKSVASVTIVKKDLGRMNIKT